MERGSTASVPPEPTNSVALTPGANETLKTDLNNTRHHAGRYFAYLFDDRDILPTDMIAVRDAALRHLRNVPITDRAAVYTFSGRAALDFTGDRAELEDVLAKLRVQMARGHGEIEACPDVSYYLADLIVNAKDERALDAVTRQTAECIHGQTDPRFVALSAARKEIYIGAQDTRIAFEVLKMTIRRLAELPGQRAIVPASPGFFPRTPDERSALENVLNLAARNNVIINTLDVRGVYSTRHSDVSSGLAPPPRSRPNEGPPPVASSTSNAVQPNDVEGQYYLQSAIASGDVLEDLAADTGGTYFHGNNDLMTGFERSADAPEVRYVIGFSPSDPKPDGSFHSLRVKILNQRRVSIQVRRGYFASNPVASETWDQIHDAVFSSDETSDIPLDVAAQISKAGTADATLTVVANVRAECLHYQRSDGQSHDSLTVVWALFNEEGDYVDGTTKTVTLDLSDGSLARADAGFGTQSSYAVKPGTYLVRVVIRETNGEVISAIISR